MSWDSAAEALGADVIAAHGESVNVRNAGNGRTAYIRAILMRPTREILPGMGAIEFAPVMLFETGHVAWQIAQGDLVTDGAGVRYRVDRVDIQDAVTHATLRQEAEA